MYGPAGSEYISLPEFHVECGRANVVSGYPRNFCNSLKYLEIDSVVEAAFLAYNLFL